MTNLKKLTELYVPSTPHGPASLCKFEQISNWERRPLRLSQMHYAALDAHILIQIFQQQHYEVRRAGYDLSKNFEILEKKVEITPEDVQMH